MSMNLPRRPRRALASAVPFGIVLALTGAAQAQISEPGPTSVRERITGTMLAATGTPDPAAGDMIGAFFGSDQVCGRFVFSGTTVSRDFNILIYGDLASTAAIKEGPTRNQRVTFKFYDASANALLPMTVLSRPGGENFNFTYQGTEVPPIPIDLPGLDLTPSRAYDLRIGESSGGNGNGNGTPAARYDINGDGKVTIEDAALILRQISGGNMTAPSASTAAAQSSTATGTTGTGSTGQSSTTTTTQATTGASMDVNRDQRIDFNDAIEVIRNKGL